MRASDTRKWIIVADVGCLCGGVEMIELEDDWIALPALHAWVLAQKLHDKHAIRMALQRVVPLIPLQIRSLVVLIMLLRILPTARAAT
jgi:hypothetical protein